MDYSDKQWETVQAFYERHRKPRLLSHITSTFQEN